MLVIFDDVVEIITFSVNDNFCDCVQKCFVAFNIEEYVELESRKTLVVSLFLNFSYVTFYQI